MISAREKGLFQLLVSMQIMAILASYCIVFVIILWFIYNQNPSLHAYSKYAIVAMVAMILEATFRPGALRPTPGRIKRLAAAISRRQWVWMLASMTALLVFSKDQRISRTFLATFALIALFTLYLTNRYFIIFVGSLGFKHAQRWRLRTLVLGPRTWCESVIPEIDDLSSMLEVRRVRWTDQDRDIETDYAELIREEPIDLLVMPPRHLPDATVMDLLRQGDRMGFRCWMPLELTRAFGRRFDLQRAGRLDMLTPPVEPLENTSNQLTKRAFDIIISLMVVVSVLPFLCLIVSLIHRFYSPGPLFFKQDRVGKNGVTFKVIKFRTLHPQNENEARQVSKGDSRVFKGGRFLRKSSLDELPQFINVLFGDMSVVGPRPHMEKHDEEFREIFERYGFRRYVKPGVTGLAQIRGYRGEIRRPKDLRHRARLDNFYITHWDFGMDFRIVAMTGLIILKPPKTAY